MNIKKQFTIKDLENLSGVKAHTIRIWEKRYNLLTPERTDTNIRYYSLDNLKKLLNITYLYNEGHKISKLAKLKDHETQRLIEIQSTTSEEVYAIGEFKKAMFEFNEQLFNQTYTNLLAKRTFREIFFEIFVPLFMEIGTLWQTNTLEPCHESFISELVKRKIIYNIEYKANSFSKQGKTLFALFLPYKEVHEIGLLYAKYEVISAGFNSVYLGANIPLNNLIKLTNIDDNIIFISYLTMEPEGKNIQDYLSEFQNTICSTKKIDLWLLGKKTQELDAVQLDSNIQIISGLEDLISNLQNPKIR